MPPDLYHLLTPLHTDFARSRYISDDGLIHKKRGASTAVSITASWRRLKRTPEAIVECLRSHGLRYVEDISTYAAEITFTRVKDGAKFTCTVEFTEMKLDWEADIEALLEKGFGRFCLYAGEKEAGFLFPYIPLSVQWKLDAFLRGSGLVIDYYTPPWLEEEKLEFSPSSRRPGREAARFFGFS